MMKAIDSSRSGKHSQPHGSFFRELFSQLDRLGKLQLTLCPRSRIHVNESVVDHDDCEKLKAVYEQLSLGSRFEHHEKVYAQQIRAGLEAWLQGKRTLLLNLDPSKVVGNAVSEWVDWFRTTVDRPTTQQLTEELSASKARLRDSLARVIARWQAEPGKRFEDWFAEEVSAHGEALIKCWIEYGRTASAVCRGELSPGSFPNLNYAVRLVSEILLRLEAAGFSCEQRFTKAREFFASAIFRQIPVVRTGAALWAGLAHRFHAGQRRWDASIVNDVTAISTYLPYCDAMFLEKECASVLNTNPARSQISFETQVFSLQTRDAFPTFLKEVEASASKQHLEMVREVYGRFWEMPFTTLKPAE